MICQPRPFKNQADLLQIHLGLEKKSGVAATFAVPSKSRPTAAVVQWTSAVPGESGIFQLMSDLGIWYFFTQESIRISLRGPLGSYNPFLENNPVSLAAAQCSWPKFSLLIPFNTLEYLYSLSSIHYFMVGSEA